MHLLQYKANMQQASTSGDGKQTEDCKVMLDRASNKVEMLRRSLWLAVECETGARLNRDAAQAVLQHALSRPSLQGQGL